MEIKRMNNRNVRIAPEYITHETCEYVELSDSMDDYDDAEVFRRTDESDEEWKDFCELQGNEPWTKEFIHTTVSMFINPYEVFRVKHDFYGVDMYGSPNLHVDTLLEQCKYQLVIESRNENYNSSSVWLAEYFEVVKRVETIKNEYLPMGVVQEIKTISWVRDEEFYQ
jgi:hypothetical protein